MFGNWLTWRIPRSIVCEELSYAWAGARCRFKPSDAGLALHPKFAVSLIRAIGAAASDDPTYLAGFERLLEGLRKAGVPEQ